MILLVPLLHALRRAYRRDVRATGVEPRLLATIAFGLSFAAARGAAFAVKAGWLSNVELGAVHVHHMIPGLGLVLLAGLLDLGVLAPRLRAILFGIGAGLVLDEFALILHLADVYWMPAGRASIDAVILFGALLIAIVLGRRFWVDVLRILTALPRYGLRRRSRRAAARSRGSADDSMAASDRRCS